VFLCGAKRSVFLTGDENMQDQQRLEDRSFAVLMTSAVLLHLLNLLTKSNAEERAANS
jgi:uncharacterized protein (DUF2267 family)